MNETSREYDGVAANFIVRRFYDFALCLTAGEIANSTFHSVGICAIFAPYARVLN